MLFVGYTGKIFQIRSSLPVSDNDIVLVGQDGNLSTARINRKGATGLTYLELESGEKYSANLNSFNHSSSLPKVDDFRQSRWAYCKFLVDKKRTVADGLTGQALDIESQVLKIKLGRLGESGPASFGEVGNATDMAKKVWALHNSLSRHHLGVASYVPSVICSKAGSGKTWACQQMRHAIAKCVLLKKNYTGLEVPLLVPVQQLIALVEQKEGFQNLLRRYIHNLTDRQIGVDSKVTDMLLTAVNLRSIILIIDGIDEAGELSNAMERFVMKDLILNGYTVIATARPEGLQIKTLPFYEVGISTLDLLPLTTQQQRQLIGNQTGHRWLIESLHGASEAATLLEKAWRRISAASPDTVNALERRESFNLGRSACHKIANLDGTLRCIKSNRDGPPQSGIIRILHALLTEPLLKKLARVVEKVNDSIFSARKEVTAVVTKQVVESVMKFPETIGVLYWYRVITSDKQAHTKTRKQTREWAWKVVTQLVVLSRSLCRSPQNLWNDIRADTDELYHAAETHGNRLLLAFVHGLIALCPDTHGLLQSGKIQSTAVVKVRLMKNPVRLYELAVDVHGNRETEPPTAYCSSALHGSIALVSLMDIETLLQQWPMKTALGDGSHISVQMLKRENFFSNQRQNTDPLRVRRVRCTLLLEHNGIQVLAELDIHHRDILKVTMTHTLQMDNLKEYCRIRFRETSGAKVQQLVQTYRKLYADVAGNPVQLSLLAHVMVHDITAEPPRTLLELYQKAIQCVLQQRLKKWWQKAKELLKALAIHLMLKEGAKRIFRRVDAVAAVGAEAWDWLLEQSNKNIPLIKTLNVDRFEFQHRSFQEALLAEALSLQQGVPETEFMSAQNPGQNWEVIRSGTLANVWRIGGHSVVEVLKRGLGQPKEELSVSWNKHVWSALFNCRVASYTLAFLTDLEVDDNGIDGSFHELSYFINVCSLVVVSKFSFAHRMHYTSLHHATHSVF